MSKINFSANFIEYKGNKVSTYDQVITNATSTDKYVSTSALNETIDALLQNIFPIGYILTTFNEQDYSGYLGMTWEKLENTFLYADGSKVLGTAGGAETHVLTEDEMPVHTHVHNDWIQGYVHANYRDGFNTYASPTQELNGGDRKALHGGTSSAGGSQPHNNMPPFTVVRMWRRIA